MFFPRTSFSAFWVAGQLCSMTKIPFTETFQCIQAKISCNQLNTVTGSHYSTSQSLQQPSHSENKLHLVQIIPSSAKEIYDLSSNIFQRLPCLLGRMPISIILLPSEDHSSTCAVREGPQIPRNKISTE